MPLCSLQEESNGIGNDDAALPIAAAPVAHTGGEEGEVHGGDEEQARGDERMQGGAAASSRAIHAPLESSDAFVFKCLLSRTLSPAQATLSSSALATAVLEFQYTLEGTDGTTRLCDADEAGRYPLKASAGEEACSPRLYRDTYWPQWRT